jgi:hypothetical protein
MKRISLILACLIGSVSGAFAACVSPAVMKDNASTTFNMSLATAPDTNCESNVAVPSWAGGTLGAMANFGTTPGAVLVPGVNAFVINTPNAAITSWGGGTLGAMAAYGTSPGSVLVPGVNAFVTNSNANGRATAPNSSPTVLPSTPTTWHLVAAATTNATSVKAAAAVLYSCQMSGIGAGPAYLKIFNKASAPTVGTDTPVITLIIPAAATAANGAGSNVQFAAGGVALGTGFAAAVTGGLPDADATAVAAATYVVNCQYE